MGRALTACYVLTELGEGDAFTNYQALVIGRVFTHIQNRGETIEAVRLPDRCAHTFRRGAVFKRTRRAE